MCLIRCLPIRTVWCVLGPLFLMATPFATTLRLTTSTSPSLPSTAAKRQTRRNWLSLWRTHCVSSRSYCSLPCRATPVPTLEAIWNIWFCQGTTREVFMRLFFSPHSCFLVVCDVARVVKPDTMLRILRDFWVGFFFFRRGRGWETFCFSREELNIHKGWELICCIWWTGKI